MEVHMDSNQDVNALPYNEILERKETGRLAGRMVYAPLSMEQVQLIIRLLEHKKTSVRWRAADLLGKLKEKQAMPNLTTALKDPAWLVRLHAAKALERIGDPAAVSGLVEMTKDHSPYVRRRVAKALRRFDNPESRLALAGMFCDKDSKVISSAAYGLRDANDPSIFPILIKAMETEEENTVFAAAETLALFGRDAAILVPELDRLMGKMYNPKNRFRLVGVLGSIGTKRARKVLEKYAVDPDGSVSRRAMMSLNYPYLIGEEARESELRRLLRAIGKWFWRTGNRLSNRSNALRDRGKVFRALGLQIAVRWLRMIMRDRRGIAVSDNQLSILYRTLQLFSLARWKSRSAVSYFRTIFDNKNLAPALLTQGNLYQQLRRFEKAAACFTESFYLYEADEDLTGMVSCLSGMARIEHHQNKNYDRAKVLLNQAIELGKRAGSTRFGVEYDNLGDVYADQGEWKMALECYQKALVMHYRYLPKYVPMCMRKIERAKRNIRG